LTEAWAKHSYDRLLLMQRVCFVLQVRPERLEEYKERHKAVWPEMQEALRKTGWNNYSLYLRSDGLLVGYLETEDFQKAKEGMSKQEVNERWQREMSPLFMIPPGVAPDRTMVPLEEVFHLD
jgi:L-rhamnose mutarotase